MLPTEDQFWTKKRIEQLGDREQAIVAQQMTEKTLDYEMPLHQAEKMKVKFRGEFKALKWMAKHHPSRFEVLMDTMEPGSVLFHAITVVYNHYLPKILAGVKKVNERIQKASVEGLARYRARTRMKPRPITHNNHKLTPRPITRERRMFLRPEALKELERMVA
jgi:hypothetical protein